MGKQDTVQRTDLLRVAKPYATLAVDGDPQPVQLFRTETGSALVRGDNLSVLDLPNARMLALMVKTSQARVVDSPADLYHCWHICFCPKCRGRPWDHSQGAWNEHLRFVDPAEIVTLPKHGGS